MKQPLQRLENHDVLLADWAGSLIGTPFVWGRSDCATLVRDALNTIYGRDVLSLPEWHDSETALRVYHSIGSIDEYLKNNVEAYEVPWGFAQTGDLIIESGDDGYGFNGLGVIVGGKFVGVSINGFVTAMPLHALEPSIVTILRVP